MEFSELIEKRRSVRGSYIKTETDIEEIKSILRAAQQAPSWKNFQETRCYAAYSQEALNAVRETLPDFNQRSSDGAILLVSTFVKDLAGFDIDKHPENEVGNMWGAYDLGLRDAYLVLAAKNAGYDSLIMGLRDAEKLRSVLNIPEDEEIMSVIAVGKAEVEGKERKRKNLEEVTRIF